MTKEIETKISRAKARLITKHPFFGAIALRLETRITDTVPTAGTDGKTIMYNPEFVADLTDAQTVFLVAHECGHPMLEHLHRMKGRDATRWNKAADFVINQLLTDEGIGEFIPGGCLDKALYQRGKTAEGIYALLESEAEGGGVGGTGADLMEPQGSEAEQAQQAAEWRVAVAQAAQAARMAGKLSAGLQRVVGEALQPKVPWRDVLAQFVCKARTNERSFARPNRRFLSQGLYLPSVTGEALGEIVFAIDCSGSVGPKELDQFAAEMQVVHEDMQPAKLHVLYFDTKVCHSDVFEPDDTLMVEPHGGGGTRFSPVFRHIDEHGLEPVATVFLTDLYCSDFGGAPDYPVLWVTNGAVDAPFGDVTKMEA